MGNPAIINWVSVILCRRSGEGSTKSKTSAQCTNKHSRILRHGNSYPTAQEWAAACDLKRCGRREWNGPCPLCGGTDRFHVRDGGNRALVGCRSCIDGQSPARRYLAVRFVWPPEGIGPDFAAIPPGDRKPESCKRLPLLIQTRIGPADAGVVRACARTRPEAARNLPGSPWRRVW